MVALAFLFPALFVLGALVVYPALRTLFDSFFDRFGQEFVGLDNYVDMFRFERMRTAIINSFVWVLILPVLVTAVGLIFAVLADKLAWKTAFKLIIFMPVAIAVMSSGIIWRTMYNQSPQIGVVNAVINIPLDLVSPPGPYPGATPSSDDLQVAEDGTVVVITEAGEVARIGLLRIQVDDVPADAEDATDPVASTATIAGIVWRDTKPGENEKGAVEQGEFGLPGFPVEIGDASGTNLAATTTDADGSFVFSGLDPGTYRVAVSGDVFREPWGGVSWLGPALITPAAILSGVWVWAGFALIVIGAGLASLPREVLEAAQVDGANAWQTFRRVTLPLLAPVLSVVFITLTIYALKMFDLIVGIAPGSVQDDANVIALEMWRTAFTGLGNRGLGSAIAVFLFLLILPIMVLNLRRFKLEETQG